MTKYLAGGRRLGGGTTPSFLNHTPNVFIMLGFVCVKGFVLGWVSFECILCWVSLRST